MIVAVGRTRRRAERERNAAMAHVKVLQGLLPICAGCKAIRDGDGEWHGLESYLSDHSEASLTHTLCTRCAAKYMADLQ
jgi:hypothetical protein